MTGRILVPKATQQLWVVYLNKYGTKFINPQESLKEMKRELEQK